MTESRFHFHGCTLDTGHRELRVDGRPRALEPRPFDLLVYLLRNRHRVVSTDELLDRVWPAMFVSGGAVARAVARVRKAIHDLDGNTALIRTVHRLGYRFIGEVTEEPADAAAPELSALPETPLGVVAVLPFENLTGCAALDWMTLYLMSLVCNAMALDARLSPLSMHRLADGLAGLELAPPEMRAIAVRERYGAEHVVQARLTGTAPHYQLAYRLFTGNRHSVGTVEGETPVALGRQLARLLLKQLLPDARAQDVDVATPWVSQVFDRALLMLEQGRWPQAQRLLDVVLDEAPTHPIARVLHEHVRSMSTTVPVDIQ